MLEARFNFVTADPRRLDDLVTFTEAEVCPVVETAAGSLGTSLYANPEVGVAILESFWASHARLVQSEQLVSSARHEAVARATGTVCVERYQVPVFELDAPLIAGAGLRLTRMDVAPSEVEDAVEIYGDTAVAQLAETEGFCAALAHGRRGHRSHDQRDLVAELRGAGREPQRQRRSQSRQPRPQPAA